MQNRHVAWLGALLLVLLGAVIWMLWPEDPAERQPSAAARSNASATARDSVERSRSEPTRAPSPAAKPEHVGESQRERRAKRDELREKLLAAEARRSRAPQPQRSASSQEPEPEPEPGNLKDRMGGREALIAELNRDFMPLADECIAQAQARSPELSGMLAIGIETIADEELGAIVEAVDTPAANEIDDPALHECIQQTALSLILPPPPEGGREEFMLTIPIEAE